jgi:hypothetical protein
MFSGVNVGSGELRFGIFDKRRDLHPCSVRPPILLSSLPLFDLLLL